MISKNYYTDDHNILPSIFPINVKVNKNRIIFGVKKVKHIYFIGWGQVSLEDDRLASNYGKYK